MRTTPPELDVVIEVPRGSFFKRTPARRIAWPDFYSLSRFEALFRGIVSQFAAGFDVVAQV